MSIAIGFRHVFLCDETYEPSEIVRFHVQLPRVRAFDLLKIQRGKTTFTLVDMQEEYKK